MPVSLPSTALALFVMFVAGAASARAQSDATTETLLAVERTWLAAYESHDVETMDAIVAEGFLITYEDGTQRDKAMTLAMLQPGTPDSPDWRMFTRNSRVTFFGDTAIVTA